MDQQETTTRTFYVVQQSWHGKTWRDATTAGQARYELNDGGRTIEAARKYRDRIAELYAKGAMYELREGDVPAVPKLRIQQRTTAWTVVE